MGVIEANADLTVDGEIYGKIRSAKRVMLGDSSRFEGDIECDSALKAGMSPAASSHGGCSK